MAELATIARPYAEALFQAGAADREALSVWLDAMAAVAENAQLQQFADNPNVTAKQVFDVIAETLTANFQVTLSASAKNFLETVIANGRINVVCEIAKQFRKLKNATAGASDAVVFSAFAIDATALSDLKALLEKRFERKLNLSVQLQPELIGGIRVVVGDEVLDTSVKARLEQMKVALTA
jgi:F-type H+-transporting ATPase subunit delta